MTDPNRILLAGDWHGNSSWAVAMIDYAATCDVDTIVQLGDFGFHIAPDGDYYLECVEAALTKHGIDLAFVDGNHLNYDRLYQIPVQNGVRIITPHIRHLSRGLRWQWWGWTWMALGGAHSVDSHMRTRGRNWWPQETLTDEEVEFASRPGRVDVILSHDCPFGVDIPGVGPWDQGEGWPSYQLLRSEEHRRLLEKVVKATKPKALFHGHYHRKYHGFYQHAEGDLATFVTGMDMDGTSAHANTMLIDAPHELDDAVDDAEDNENYTVLAW